MTSCSATVHDCEHACVCDVGMTGEESCSTDSKFDVITSQIAYMFNVSHSVVVFLFVCIYNLPNPCSPVPHALQTCMVGTGLRPDAWGS